MDAASHDAREGACTFGAAAKLDCVIFYHENSVDTFSGSSSATDIKFAIIGH